MRAPTSLVLALALASQAALAASPSSVARAKKLFDDLEVEEAAKVLNQALAQGGNDAQTYLQLLGLKGVVEGTLGHSREARDAFYQVLLLNPEWRLPGDQPPRVSTPFYEAKGLVSERGHTSVEGEAQTDAGTVQAVSVTVKNDALQVAKTVAFHLTSEGTERVAMVWLDDSGRATAKVGAARVSWWAEVLTAKSDVLLTLGSAGEPRQDDASPVVAAGPAVETPTEAAPEAPTQPSAEPPPPLHPVVTSDTTTSAPTASWKRPLGIGLLGGGAVAAGVGAVFGVLAESARAKIHGAQTKPSGAVTGLTQRQAFALDATARTNAIVANVLFGSAAALAATGAVFVFTGGGEGEARVTFAPTPAGVVVWGGF